jgi:hypothetical protein
MSKEELEQAAEMAQDQMKNLSPDLVDEAISALKETSTGDAVPGSSSDPVSNSPRGRHHSSITMTSCDPHVLAFWYS